MWEGGFQLLLQRAGIFLGAPLYIVCGNGLQCLVMGSGYRDKGLEFFLGAPLYTVCGNGLQCVEMGVSVTPTTGGNFF